MKLASKVSINDGAFDGTLSIVLLGILGKLQTAGGFFRVQFNLCMNEIMLGYN